MPQTLDDEYLNILITPLLTCRNYKPKFGHGAGLTLAEFQTLYKSDPFYSWFGLDTPLLYSAHRAAGGMTSIYRQIGIGCQRLIQRILMDQLGLTPEQIAWSYQIKRAGSVKRSLSLDGRISTTEVKPATRAVVSRWIQSACREVGVSAEISRALKGAVFEIRQGYKSKDSKRQNADLANAAAAYSAGYLPVLLLLSTQIDDDIAERYQNAQWLILRGVASGKPTDSTYQFCRHVIGYDLAGFFKRHSPRLKREIESILKALLT
jgi:hypothetical protein